MKSLLFSALAIVALASTGCALQSGGSANLCGQPTCAECSVMSGDCNCRERRQLQREGGIFANLSDRKGMGLCMLERGSACGKKRRADRRAGRNCGCGGGLGAASCGCDSPTTASLGDCGCTGGDSYAMESASYGDCGCGSAEFASAPEIEQVAYQEGGVAAASGCSLFGGCRLGKRGLRNGGAAAAASSVVGGIGGCGVPGCGHGNRFCSGCLSKLAGGAGFAGGGLAGKIPRPGQHPYGGAIPHTAQGPGAGTGTAPSYAYPYYTTRGPRDFLMKKPPSIGY